MRKLRVTTRALLAICLLGVGGCELTQPFNVNGREGAQALSYETLMRVGAAAHAGGDLANAIAIYRQAAVVNPAAAAPFDAAGNALSQMGQINEAILAYKSALERDGHDAEALRGLAKAYLLTARPELAGAPLAAAYTDSPDDPKLLQLLGVSEDLLGQHGEAQARYRRGLELLPNDPGLILNLALSLTITGEYTQAIALLRPLATGPTATPRQRQCLALVYGLAGDRVAAREVALPDLDPSSVEHNLGFMDGCEICHRRRGAEP